MSKLSHRLRIASVIPSLSTGGVATVCQYTADGLSRQEGKIVTLVALHDCAAHRVDPNTGLRITSLGLKDNTAAKFLDWLKEHPQDIVLSSDVAHLEPAFRYFPEETRHVVQIHDSGRRYLDVAVRNASTIDAITCVGHHVQSRLERRLQGSGFEGLLKVVNNGAFFPPTKPRKAHRGPIRLLFIGRVDSMKGAFDCVPLLAGLRRLGVGSRLTIVGGSNERLRLKLERKGLADHVTWAGCVPHSKCYDIAHESDLLLVPSRREAFGMATIEAMSMGCVPMAYDIPSGSTEIIEPDVSGILIPPGDVYGWAKRIALLDANRSELSRMSFHAALRARECFNGDLMVANMSSFLADVVASPVSRSRRRMLGELPHDDGQRARKGFYQRLPASLRAGIRDAFCCQPQLSMWLLNR